LASTLLPDPADLGTLSRTPGQNISPEYQEVASERRRTANEAAAPTSQADDAFRGIARYRHRGGRASGPVAGSGLRIAVRRMWFACECIV